jgi:uncharacterized coiled-coil DUF342 family protein
MTEQVQEQQKPDRKDLKIQALINKVTKTENENADYQVELHLKTEELQAAYQQLQTVTSELDTLRPAPSEVIDVEAEEVPDESV